MVTLANIVSWALFACAFITSCFLARRCKQLRNYTFWVEQSLLQHRPETYIPEWRKRQREKDICKKSGNCRYYVQTVERRKTQPAAETRNPEPVGAQT
ncbi:MAG: hypothetical protein ABIF19_09560 [Planctomycetota bacterium]